MKQLAATEEQHHANQAYSDGLKSNEERNRWGQFSTPIQLAVEVVKLALENRSDPSEDIRFLDPAFGMGVFLEALYIAAETTYITSAAGVELDPLLFQTAHNLWRTSQAEVLQADFTVLSPAVLVTSANLIICNPPYIRHHHLTREQKARLCDKARQATGLTLSGLAGMYCYFLLIAHEWMSPGGISAWLIPTEFMETNYGATIREYLTTQVTLKKIHRFNSLDVQFTDALVSSAVVVFQKVTPQPDTEVIFTVGGTPTNPQRSYPMRLDHLRQENKWTRPLQGYRQPRVAQDLTLGNLFEIHRGIATGANSFFILTRDAAQRRSLPGEFLRPVLPSPRYLKTPIITADQDLFPEGLPQLVLLDCPLPEEEVQEQYPALWNYLESGISQGIHQRYLTSRRTPWYRQESRAYTPFLCTYMGRSNGGKQPFSFIWNQSCATAPNVYHLFYPRKHWATLLTGDLERQAQVFKLLSQIRMEDIVSEGRTYGGGLHKIEPREFYGIKVTYSSAIQEFLLHQ
jgi:adenine-specific DNA-methyltransferase